MWMTRLLSTTFSSIKPHSRLPKSTISSTKLPPVSSSESDHLNWSVYLILSTNPPFKTYVGVTTNFSRRLRQHNGELKGGAKASQAGRPWICVCLIRGFASKSEGFPLNLPLYSHKENMGNSDNDNIDSPITRLAACKFEFRWKNVSSKMPRKRKTKEEEGGAHLLQHRNATLNKVKDSTDCSHLEFDWKLEPI